MTSTAKSLLFSVAVCILHPAESSWCQVRPEETYLEAAADASEQSELADAIQELRENPIDINTATRQQLDVLPWLSPKLRDEIIRHRKQNGLFRKKHDVLRVAGMDRETFAAIDPFIIVKVAAVPSIRPYQIYQRSRISDRIDKPVGFKNGTFTSSSTKIYNRMKIKLREKVEGGMLLEKDAGESSLDDLSLFYVALKPTRNIALLVGDYQLQFGQGLVLWSPYGFSKSSDAVYPIKRRARGQRGYLSVDENAALRGASAFVRWRNLEITSFVSRSNLDATQVTDEAVSGISATGLHRTENERSKKDVLQETVVGGRLAYGQAGLVIGGTFYRSSYDKLILNLQLERKRFAFSGDDNHVAGFDWAYQHTFFDFFGEFAASKSGGRAVVAGGRFDFGEVELALLYRNYDRDFHNLHAFGFGERNGETQNERGYYMGMTYRLSRSAKLNAYYDFYKFPWRTFFEPLPREGREFMAQLEQKFGGRVGILIRFRDKVRQETEKLTNEFNLEVSKFFEFHQRQFRLQLNYRLTRQVFLRSRVEFVHINLNGYGQALQGGNENGLLFYQDVRFKPSRRFQVTARLTFFNTDSFDSRVFQYENDLPGLITNRALHGRGRRWYLLLKYQPFRQMALHVKYSQTSRDDVDFIGSGSDRIDGNRDRRVAAQVEMRL